MKYIKYISSNKVTFYSHYIARWLHKYILRIMSCELRPSSDVVLLPCRTKLQFGSTVAQLEINSDSDIVPDSNQIQGLLKPRNNSPHNYLRERNLTKTH